MKRNDTNLRQVKSTALAFLYLDIQTTKFSPVVVKHPFFETGITAVKQEDELRVLNILESEANLELVRKTIEHQIHEADTVLQISMIITKPYKLVFLKYIQEYLSPEDIAHYLKSNWTLVENISGDVNVSRTELIKIFKKANRDILFTDVKEDTFYQKKDSITIYRGTTSNRSNQIKGLSWTRDIKIARYFANRFKQGGSVYKAQINPKDILAYFTGRSESEVVVNYRGLQNITQIEEISPSGEIHRVG